MVDFVSTLGVVTSFIANVLNLPFFGFGTFGTVVLIFLLLSLVRDGDLKLERAAEKARMTVEQFETVMENTPLQAV